MVLPAMRTNLPPRHRREHQIRRQLAQRYLARRAISQKSTDACAVRGAANEAVTRGNVGRSERVLGRRGLRGLAPASEQKCRISVEARRGGVGRRGGPGAMPRSAAGRLYVRPPQGNAVQSPRSHNQHHVCLHEVPSAVRYLVLSRRAIAAAALRRIERGVGAGDDLLGGLVLAPGDKSGRTCDFPGRRGPQPLDHRVRRR